MKNAKVGDFGWLVLRLGLAMVMVYHGSQKMFGAFGGPGLSTTLEMFQSKNGIPQWLGMLAIIAETFGGLGVGLGLLTRVAAFGVACTMGMAAYVTIKNSMEWSVSELPIILCCAAICLLANGAGQLSLDAVFFKKKK
jgi:putative oxidoreductase